MLKERKRLGMESLWNGAPVISKATLGKFCPNEWKILYCLARRFTNVEIADELGFTKNTIRYYTKQMYWKIDMVGMHGLSANRLRLVAWCEENISAIESSLLALAVAKNSRAAHICKCKECVERRNRTARK
jgi:DNA-binding CsgD family transcriptional regulator